MLVSALPTPAFSHSGWHWQIQYERDFPTGKTRGVDLANGLGFEGTVSVNLSRQISADGGWGLRSFNLIGSNAQDAVSIQNLGYTLGLQWQDYAVAGDLGYRLRIGARYGGIDVENQQGLVTEWSGNGYGWELGFALIVPLGDHWELTPGVRYKSLPGTIVINNESRSFRLGYVAVGLGISHRF